MISAKENIYILKLVQTRFLLYIDVLKHILYDIERLYIYTSRLRATIVILGA